MRVVQPYSQETKAAAVAELAAGGSLAGTARKHGVNKATLRRWRADAGLAPSRLSPEKKADLGEQLYDYLAESIATLVAQLRFARDPKWLAKQNAADLAVFMGVTADKATRLLAALRPAGDGDKPLVIDLPAPQD